MGCSPPPQSSLLAWAFGKRYGRAGKQASSRENGLGKPAPALCPFPMTSCPEPFSPPSRPRPFPFHPWKPQFGSNRRDKTAPAASGLGHCCERWPGYALLPPYSSAESPSSCSPASRLRGKEVRESSGERGAAALRGGVCVGCSGRGSVSWEIPPKAAQLSWVSCWGRRLTSPAAFCSAA